jgi:Ca-activated chloride channel homolog
MMIIVKSRNTQRRLLGVLALAFVMLALGFTGYSQSAQEPLPPPDAHGIAVKSELVVLPVRVVDAHGDFVPGLKLDNFRVYEDGRPQRLSVFQQEDAPVTVGLVVDHSRSMGSKLAGVTAAILAFAQSSNPKDEMFVVDFNDKVSLELPNGDLFTHDPKELAKTLAAVSARGQTALYDAVNEGLNHLQLASGNKKALIIVSDGGDDASTHKFADVLALARQSQAAIYSIGLIDEFSADQDPRVLQRLSDETGGVAFFPKGDDSVEAASASIARDLREQYTVGFTPDDGRSNGVFRKIAVKVAAPGRGKLRVRTRRGYTKLESAATHEENAR